MIDIPAIVRCDEPGCMVEQKMEYHLPASTSRSLDFLPPKNWRTHWSGRIYCPAHAARAEEQ